MKKKLKQIILKIILDKEDNNILGWETTIKGFDKGLRMTDEVLVNTLTSILNHLGEKYG